VYTNLLDICYNLPAVLNIIFDYPFLEKGAPRESTMVLLDRVMIYANRLAVQTTVVPGTVWPQFTMQVLTGVESPLFGGKGWS